VFSSSPYRDLPSIGRGNGRFRTPLPVNVVNRIKTVFRGCFFRKYGAVFHPVGRTMKPIQQQIAAEMND